MLNSKNFFTFLTGISFLCAAEAIAKHEVRKTTDASLARHVGLRAKQPAQKRDPFANIPAVTQDTRRVEVIDYLGDSKSIVRESHSNSSMQAKDHRNGGFELINYSSSSGSSEYTPMPTSAVPQFLEKMKVKPQQIVRRTEPGSSSAAPKNGQQDPLSDLTSKLFSPLTQVFHDAQAKKQVVSRNHSSASSASTASREPVIRTVQPSPKSSVYTASRRIARVPQATPQTPRAASTQPQRRPQTSVRRVGNGALRQAQKAAGIVKSPVRKLTSLVRGRAHTASVRPAPAQTQVARTPSRSRTTVTRPVNPTVNQRRIAPPVRTSSASRSSRISALHQQTIEKPVPTTPASTTTVVKPLTTPPQPTSSSRVSIPTPTPVVNVAQPNVPAINALRVSPSPARPMVSHRSKSTLPVVVKKPVVIKQPVVAKDVRPSKTNPVASSPASQRLTKARQPVRAPAVSAPSAPKGTLLFKDLPPELKLSAIAQVHDQNQKSGRKKVSLPNDSTTFTEDEAVAGINFLNEHGQTHLAQRLAAHLNSKGIKTYTLRFGDASEDLKSLIREQATLENEPLPDANDQLTFSEKQLRKALQMLQTAEPQHPGITQRVRNWLRVQHGFQG